MRFPSVMLALAGLTVFATGCSQETAADEDASTTSSQAVATSTTQAAPTDAAFAPEGYDTIVTADGRTRSYRVVDLSADGPAPLLFVLHGFGGDAEGMRSYARIEESVEATLDDGAVVVYPNGTGFEEGLPQSWNAGGCCPFAIYDMVDDVSFFDQLISKLEAQHDIDAARVWVVGHSNGGMMAYRLACELSARVTAVGIGAGALMTDSCQPGRPVSAMHLHGELDNVVPMAGGETAGIAFPSASESFERFAAANACPVVDAGDDPVADCPGGATIALRTDANWTHDWQSDWTSILLGFLAGQARA